MKTQSRRCRPRRARKSACRAAATARRPLLLWPDPPGAPDPRNRPPRPAFCPKQVPFVPFSAHLPPRSLHVLAERGPTRSSRAQRVQNSWLKSCPRSCRALCAWRRLFHGAVGETRSTFPAHGTAMPADLCTGTGARAVRLGGGGGLREEARAVRRFCAAAAACDSDRPRSRLRSLHGRKHEHEPSDERTDVGAHGHR